MKEIASKGFGKFLWGGRQVVMGKTPEIEPLASDFSTYDLIFYSTEKRCAVGQKNVQKM
ncbi:MAG: hypothetical protein JXO44_14180 [Clostridia bacterium]|nr:hypothetical protein [Clostridia bacterium]